MYNITNLTNAKYGYELVYYANEVTNGVFIGGFIISLFIIITFVFMKSQDVLDSMIGSSFFSFVFALFFTAIGLIGFQFVLIFLLITALLSFYKIFIVK